MKPTTLTHRQVEFTHRQHIPASGEFGSAGYTSAKYETVTLTGFFHQFATEGDGQDIGPVAIIETPDGQIHTPNANKIKFIS